MWLFVLQRCCSVKCDCYTTAYSACTTDEESGSVHACINGICLLQSKAYWWSSLSTPCGSQEADWFFRVCLFEIYLNLLWPQTLNPDLSIYMCLFVCLVSLSIHIYVYIALFLIQKIIIYLLCSVYCINLYLMTLGEVIVKLSLLNRCDGWRKAFEELIHGIRVCFSKESILATKKFLISMETNDCLLNSKV